MNRQQALNQLRIMQAWHEDFGNGPCPDYDAICYAIGVIEEAPEGLDNLIKALEQEHKKLLEMQKALKNVPDTNVGDTISRQAAIADARSWVAVNGFEQSLQKKVIEWLKEFPSAQPETTTMTVGRTKGEITMWYECDNCGEPVDQSDNYCRECGRKFI